MNTALSFQYEKRLQEQGMLLIAGIDEAGRGPLAGPVVAGACILASTFDIEGLNDSKKLSEKQRERMYEQIVSFAADYGIGIAEPEEIDQLNILQASFLAMYRAFKKLKKIPDAVLVDGHLAPSLGVPTIPIIKGDSLSPSIAAGSILAKVTRDRIMKELSLEYSCYRFEKHKGYPTKEHLALLKQYGPCAIHRKSFSPLA